MTETILQEAERLINGDRQEQYGNACQSLERIADMWNAYIFTTSEPPAALTAMDVANMMVLLKVSRSKTSLDRSEFHRDSHVDMAGYAGLGGRAWDEIQESVAQQKPKDEQPEWGSLLDVPGSVYVVYDAQGDSWHSYNGQSYWLRDSDETGTRHRHAESFGPFTEWPKNV